MRFLINPPERATAHNARSKMAARRKARRKAPAKRKVRRNPPARFTAKRRRSVRRNPRGGIVGDLTRAGMDSLAIIGGEVAVNLIAAKVPVLFKDAAGVETAVGKTVRQVIGTAAIAFVARKAFGSDLARTVVAGAMTAPTRSLVRKALPATGMFSQALGAYPGFRGGALAMGAYPQALLPARTPTLSGVVAPFAYQMAGG